jgi:hypothetical protein
MQIVLDTWTFEECRLCALQRDSNRLNSTDYSSDKTDDKSIWSFCGVVGEVALLTYFNLKPDWKYLSTDEGFCGVDVGELWEARSMMKGSNRLFLWSDEIRKDSKLSCAWSKIIVNLESRSCEIAGWAMGYEIADSGVHAKYDCKRSSYFLSNSNLRNHVDPTIDNDTAIYLHHDFLNKAA